QGRRGAGGDRGGDQHHQRGQPHRRPGRARHRGVDHGARGLRRDRVLAVPALVRRQRPGRLQLQRRPVLLRGAGPAGDRHAGLCGGRGLRRVPVVERLTGEDLHGRHRVDGAGGPDRRDGGQHAYRAVVADHRRPAGGDHHVGDHPDRLVQDHRQAGVPDVAAAPPLRAGRLVGGERGDPVLDHRRDRGRDRAGRLLRRLPRRHRVTMGAGDRWDGRPVVVAGAAVAGAAAARALLRRGAVVTVVDRRTSAGLEELAAEGATVVVADAPPAGLFDGVRDLVVSPGFAPHHPLVTAALAAGLEVYSEPELAWRLRGPQAPPWLAVTGTNGKTTTVTMLAAILRAAGLRSAAVGNIGTPLVDLPAAGEDGYDVLAVELSSQQL